MDNSNDGSMGSAGATAAANAAGDLPGGLTGLLSQPLEAAVTDATEAPVERAYFGVEAGFAMPHVVRGRFVNVH